MAITDTVKYLIDKKIDINQTDIENTTALMWASVGGYLPTIKYLIANGMDINAL